MRSVVIAAVVSGLVLSGCATSPMGVNYQPVVDLQGKDGARYQQDLVECQTLARQRDNAAANAMAGAVAMALVGAILAPSGYRNNVAGRAALIGAGAGAGDSVMTQQNIIKQCLSGRGYSVLN